ncbi:MAG: glycosyltransferase family 4 protein [Planctomycetota bacterium]|nr:glycosyltransferase family 4 protein [Planctomycetota bacterium]
MVGGRLKICYICEATAGGVRKHLRDLILGLPSGKFEIAALLGDRGEPGFAEDVRKFQARGAIVSLIRMGREISPVADFRALRTLQAAIKSLRPDIVHTHGSKGGFLGRLAASSTGVPRIVHTPHTFAFQWARGTRRWAYMAAERFAAGRCHMFVAVGPSQRDLIVASGLAPPERIRLIENGVDHAVLFRPETRAEIRRELGIGEGAAVVGMVARLAPQKGVRRFVEAARLVADAEPEARFVLIGGGPLEGQVRSQVSSLRLADRLLVLGHREDAERLYPAFDVFVLSSLYEGMPYVLLEAQAAGLPVVATNVPGNSDAVSDGETGILVPPEDTGAIAGAVISLLRDPQRRCRMAGAGRRLVAERFALREFLRRHEELYLETGSHI